MASALGVKAVDLLNNGIFGRMVAWQNGDVVDVAIEDAIKECNIVDVKGMRVHTARALGISFGDK